MATIFDHPHIRSGERIRLKISRNIRQSMRVQIHKNYHKSIWAIKNRIGVSSTASDSAPFKVNVRHHYGRGNSPPKGFL